jgi:hypothetical protein
MPRKIEEAEPAEPRPMGDGRAAKAGTGSERLLTPAEATQFGDAVTQERSAPTFVLFTPKEAATRLKVSQSFLAKARMRGDGPPYIMIGRSIRYSEAALIQWMRSQQRLSTSE